MTETIVEECASPQCKAFEKNEPSERGVRHYGHGDAKPRACCTHDNTCRITAHNRHEEDHA